MRRTLSLSARVLAAALTLGACGGDDDRLDAGERKKASAAALEAVGGGAVTSAEKGEDGVAYEVEVTLPNGIDLDVELDDDFTVTNDPPKASQLEEPTSTATVP